MTSFFNPFVIYFKKEQDSNEVGKKYLKIPNTQGNMFSHILGF